MLPWKTLSATFQCSMPYLVPIHALVPHHSSQGHSPTHGLSYPQSPSLPALWPCHLCPAQGHAKYCGWLALAGDDHAALSGWAKGVQCSELSTWLPTSPRRQFTMQSLGTCTPLHPIYLDVLLSWPWDHMPPSKSTCTYESVHFLKLIRIKFLLRARCRKLTKLFH